MKYRLLLILFLTLTLASVSADTQLASTHYLPLVARMRNITGHGIAHDFVGEPAHLLETTLDRLDNSGANTVRMPLRWAELEPVQGEFNWVPSDRAVNALRARGYDIVAVINWVPTWANGKTLDNVPDGHWPEVYPPTNPHDYTLFVQAVAERYRGQISGYEIFNEPNLDIFWRPEANPLAYIPFLCNGYAAIKDADPMTKVASGGIAGNGISIGRASRSLGQQILPPKADVWNFLPTLYDQGAGNCFDVVSIHPYMHPTNYTIDDLQNNMDLTRALMNANGDHNKEIWLTEIGWSTAPETWGLPTVTEQELAEWVTAVYTELEGPDRIYWYNFRDIGIDPLDPEHHFGLLDIDLNPKLAFDAFKAAAPQQ